MTHAAHNPWAASAPRCSVDGARHDAPADAQVLWIVRTTAHDAPDALGSLARILAGLGPGMATSPAVAPQPGVAVQALDGFGGGALVAADVLGSSGATEIRVWSTAPHPPADPGTTVPPPAARVVTDPRELAGSVADLLGARLVTDRLAATDPRPPARPEDGTLLRIPSPWGAAFTFTRPGEPFTAAEVDEARRLADLAGRLSRSRKQGGHR